MVAQKIKDKAAPKRMAEGGRPVRWGGRVVPPCRGRKSAACPVLQERLDLINRHVAFVIDVDLGEGRHDGCHADPGFVQGQLAIVIGIGLGKGLLDQLR